MEIIRPGTNINFVGTFRWALGFSALLILLSLGSLLVRGPNYGVDFTGGTMLQVRLAERPRISDIRRALAPLGLADATIQDFGSGGNGIEYLIRLPMTAEEVTAFGEQVTRALGEQFGGDAFEVLREEMVGPRVGRTLRTQAILAVVFATIMMGAYISFRFQLRFGLGAAAALTHDVVIALGALSLLNYEFDLTVVAALLTVIGFSVNDTVIVSDRIRENLRKNRRDPLSVIINTSINETLSRTILTSGTAIMVLLSLFFLGGNVINGFAFTLLVGITIGTYSSIYVASPIVLQLERRRAR